MRYTQDRHYLHPVLGLQAYNYPERSFSVNLNMDEAINTSDLHFHASFETDAENVKAMVKSDDASSVIIVYCAATSFREIFSASDGDPFAIEVRIPISNLRGKVEFHPQIVTSRLAMLDTAEASEVYQGMPIPLPAGVPVAMHPPYQTEVNDEDDNPRSIFQFAEDSTLATGEWDVAIDHQQRFLKINFHPETKQYFEEMRKVTPWRTVETLYLSVMTYVLEEHRRSDHPWTEEEPPDEKLWWHVLQGILERHKIRLTDDDEPIWEQETRSGTRTGSSFWVAQKLLEEPLRFLPVIQEDSAQKLEGETDG